MNKKLDIKTIRKELESIFGEIIKLSTQSNAQGQEAELEKIHARLRGEFEIRDKNSIFQTKMDENDNARKNITCFAYALILKDSPRCYKMIVEELAKPPKNPSNFFQRHEFVRYLIDNNALQGLKCPAMGSIALSFSEDEKPAHAGIVVRVHPDESNIVIESKWGTYNKIFEHKLWHIPTSYGSMVKYYHPISPKEMLRSYREFMENDNI